MMTFLYTMMGALFSNLMKTINPMKASLNILLASSVIFLVMTMSAGTTWISSVFYLLFMGGILMMFMILSSLSPNEASKKMKFQMGVLIFVSLMASAEPVMTLEMTQMLIKNFLSKTETLLVSSLLIVIFFFSFISLICNQKVSMRSTICHKKTIL